MAKKAKGKAKGKAGDQRLEAGGKSDQPAAAAIDLLEVDEKLTTLVGDYAGWHRSPYGAQVERVRELRQQLQLAEAKLRTMAEPMIAALELLAPERLKAVAESEPYDEALRKIVGPVKPTRKERVYASGKSKTVEKKTGAKPWKELQEAGASDEQIAKNLQSLWAGTYGSSSEAGNWRLEINGTSWSLQFVERDDDFGWNKTDVVKGKQAIVAAVRRVMGVPQAKAGGSRPAAGGGKKTSAKPKAKSGQPSAVSKNGKPKASGGETKPAKRETKGAKAETPGRQPTAASREPAAPAALPERVAAEIREYVADGWSDNGDGTVSKNGTDLDVAELLTSVSSKKPSPFGRLENAGGTPYDPESIAGQMLAEQAGGSRPAAGGEDRSPITDHRSQVLASLPSEMHRKLLRAAMDKFPTTLSRTEVVAGAGYKPGGKTNAALNDLVKAGHLAASGRSNVAASESLFVGEAVQP